MLGILPALSAEPAGDKPDLAFRDLENTSGERLTHPVGVLHIGVEGEAVLAGVPDVDRTARLHKMRIHPADDVAALDDVLSPGEGRLGRGFVAGLEQVRDVVGALVPYSNLALRRLRGVGDRGQRFVIDVDQLGGIFRLRQRLGYDEGDLFADIAHRAPREAEKGASEHRRPVRPFALERYAHDAELGLDELVASHDQRSTRRGLGCRAVKLTDASVGCGERST
jgi:hypothetical protein